MKLLLAERFQKDLRSLSDGERSRCFDALLSIPGLVGQVHRHTGAGLRKIHRSGIYEAPLGLRLRLLVAHRDNTITLILVGNHDEVRRYLAAV